MVLLALGDRCIAQLATEPPAVRPSIPTQAPEVRTIRIPGTVVGFELVRVPMGDLPALWVARREVTWDLYDIYLYALDVPDGTDDIDGVSRPSKPYVPPDRGMGHAGFPAMGMTRQAAEAFCDWLSERIGLRARLPTPAEFESYAMIQPGIETGELAWIRENSNGTTHPAGTRGMNPQGLYDTLGNVAEWVMTDGRRPIAMGGSFRESAADCTPQSSQQQTRSWNQSDPQIPKSQWWLADCSWVGFRFVVEAVHDRDETGHGSDTTEEDTNDQ